MRRTRGYPFLLNSYLVREMLGPFFASLLIINCIFFLGRLIPFLNVIVDMGVGFGDFIRLFSYLFPNMLLYSIPMSSMFGVVVAFTRLANDGEIMAMKAAGIGIGRMLPAVLVVSLATSLLAGYSALVLNPASDKAMKKMMFNLVKEKVSKGVKAREFSDGMGKYVLYADEVNKETGQWSGVYLADMNIEGTPMITLARRGHISSDLENMSLSLVLEDGSIHRAQGATTQTILFENYELDIPIRLPLIVEHRSKRKINRRGMSLPELREQAEKLGATSELGLPLLMEFHKRLVLPVGCFVLSLLGFVFGLEAGVGKKAIGIPLGLLSYIVYWVLFSLAKTLAENQTLPVEISLWLPNLLFFLIAISLMDLAAREKSILGGGRLLTLLTFWQKKK
ncbi:MAG: LptF/LptG family permease [Thermodesulfobacteriota bacterium]